MSGNVFSAEVGLDAKFRFPSDLDKYDACTRHASVVAYQLDVSYSKLRQVNGTVMHTFSFLLMELDMDGPNG